ncbi:MAG: Diaminopimelate epimerase [Alphaproteobacteria bacterium MarineAlpha6_Bin4]|nr:MAG: Diaminopimelate epimerase [Alphaproteobacteria bacterium MarineAlpha6_Bin4]
MIFNYTKMHGLKNDFVIIDAREKNIFLNNKKIKKIADRRRGLGCDQVVVLKKSKKKGVSALIKFYNSDGSKTKACGNAARCVAFLLMKENKTKKTSIETESSLLNANLNNKNLVSVDIGKPFFKWNKIPLKRNVKIGEVNFGIESYLKPFLVNVGNPHIIFFVKDLKKINLRKVGPKIEKNILFPQKINVNFAKILNNNKIELKVWERGAGITKACGTGASATTVAAIKNKLISKRICYIHMEGGKLKIEYKKNGHIVMTGPIKTIKKGVLNNYF